MPRRRALTIFCTLLAPALALHCGRFSGSTGSDTADASSDASPSPLDGNGGEDSAPKPNAPDAGVTFQWATLLLPVATAAFATPATFAKGIVKLGGTNGQLVVSGTFEGTLPGSPPQISNETDVLYWYLDQTGATKKVDVDVQPEAQTGGAVIASEEQGLFALSFLDPDQKAHVSFAKPPEAFGAPLALADTRKSGHLARGKGNRLVYAGNKENGDLFLGWVEPGKAELEGFGPVAVQASSRLGTSFALAGSAKDGSLDIMSCGVAPSPHKQFLVALGVGELLGDKPQSQCTFRSIITGFNVTVDVITELPNSAAADDDGGLLVVGRAEGNFHYLLGDASLDSTNAKPSAANVKTIDAGSDGSIFLLKVRKDGAFDDVRLIPRKFNSADSQVTAATARPDGRVVLVGTLGASVDFGGGALPHVGNADGFVALLNRDLTHRWSTSFGDKRNQFVHAVAADENAIYVTGETDGALGLGTAVSPNNFMSAFVAKFTAP